MSEELPKPVSKERSESPGKQEIIALARELYESQETFPFPGLEPEAYAELKAFDEEFPGYATPVDQLLERFKNEGMKVVFGEDPESGNIHILPAQSSDIENDMIPPKHFQTSSGMNPKLKELIEKSKRRSLELKS